MKRKRVVSLFDLTGNMVRPWAEAGYDCWIIDIEHKDEDRDGIHLVNHDLTTPWLPPFPQSEIAMVFSSSPCTDMAVSGSRWMKGKGLRKLGKGITLFATGIEFCEWSGAPFMAEHPISTISTYYRKPDHIFHPFEYAGLHPEDNYTKSTCLWTGGGFVMPNPVPMENSPQPDSRIHHAAPGPERANFRSVAPTGFSKAVFQANDKERIPCPK